jgi:hypothetical protein
MPSCGALGARSAALRAAPAAAACALTRRAAAAPRAVRARAPAAACAVLRRAAAVPPSPARNRRTRRAAPAAPAAAGGDESDAVGLGDLVELQLGGFSCTSRGFAVLLSPKGLPLLPPAPNAVERLRGAAPPPPPPAPPGARALALAVTRDAADASAPCSVAALTLLQLAQAPPIDMGGALLPYDALARLTGAEEALLGAVIVAAPGDAAAPWPQPGAFEATLLAGGADAPGAFAVADAWTAVALALRCAAQRRSARADPGPTARRGVLSVTR